MPWLPAVSWGLLLLMVLLVGRGRLVRVALKLEGTRQLTCGSGVEKVPVVQKEGPDVLLGIQS